MWFLLIFVVAPLVELYVFFQVATAIGFLNAVGVAVLSTIIGMALVKRAGIGLWRRASQRMAAGEPPDNEMVDGLFVLIAGLLFIAPGFLSDVVGAFLLLPPIRALCRPLIIGRWNKRAKIVVTYDGPQQGDPFRATYGGDVLDTTGREAPTEPPRPLPPGERNPGDQP